MAKTNISANKDNENGLINGSFEYWQRGTSFPAVASGALTADRWRWRNNSATYTHSRSTDVPSSAFGQYSLLMDCTTADVSIAASDLTALEYRLEGNFFRRFKGKNIVLKFWVKATKTGINCVSFQNSSQNRSLVKEFTINASNVWEQKTIRFTHDNTGTWLYDSGIGVRLHWALAAGTDHQTTPDTWQTGLFYATSNQVNNGDDVANNFQLSDVHFCLDNEFQTKDPEFQLAGRDLAEELMLCQRYYEVIVQSGAADICFAGRNSATTQNRSQWLFKVDKRNTPNMSTSGFTGIVATSSSSLTVSSIDFSNTNTKFANMLSAITGATSGTIGNLTVNTGSIIADAEL